MAAAWIIKMASEVQDTEDSELGTGNWYGNRVSIRSRKRESETIPETAEGIISSFGNSFFEPIPGPSLRIAGKGAHIVVDVCLIVEVSKLFTSQCE